MSIGGRFFIPRLYYIITPVFILLDYFWGINVRVAILDSEPLYKGLYYGFCVLCGVFVFVIPQSARVVILFESSIIFVMTVIGLFIPYARAIAQMDDILNSDILTAGIVEPPHIVNLVLAAGVSLFTIKMNLRGFGMSDN
ncbi:MAG: hypothetical protein JW715_12835 [Sedimentisphaerales bacterium]|nr:hypothetical protein [Sedimentisphaerales bacterium]